MTVALAEAGASRVVAIEFDRALVPALGEAVGGYPVVEVLAADATTIDWPATLGAGPWVCCGNLPYNVGTTIVLDVLAGAPVVRTIVVMLQREVGERLVAAPGSGAPRVYGAVSLRVAYHARATLVRTVPPEVFWPRPSVGSVVVRLQRRDHPPVDVDEAALWRVVDVSFAERRKTMRNAVRRLGVEAGAADAVLRDARVEPAARPETLDLAAFARVVEALPA